MDDGLHHPLLWVATATTSPAQNYETIVKFHGANGELPYGSLVQGKDGSFYGTTLRGGVSNLGCILGCGTEFKITPAGRLTVLHRFRPAPNCKDLYKPLTEISTARLCSAGSIVLARFLRSRR